jgi:hypothetical protein
MYKYEMKRIKCNRCKKEKGHSSYNSYDLDNRHYLCKKCTRENKIELERIAIPNIKKQIEENSKVIKCTGCGKEQLIANFHVSRLKKHDYVCKSCSAVLQNNRYIKNKELAGKIDKNKKIKCRVCSKSKSVSDFYCGNLALHDFICKHCLSVIRSKYTKENRLKINERNALNRRKWVNYIKLEGLDVCSKCGYNKCSSAVEFHHKDPEKKKFKISDFCGTKLFTEENIKKLKEELKKCKVLCAICHREEHHKDGKNKWLEHFKLRGWGVCSKCGYCKCQWAIEFHHKDPKEKELSINKFIHTHRCTEENIKKIELEIEKCEVLCAVCHREEHYNLNKLRGESK